MGSGIGVIVVVFVGHPLIVVANDLLSGQVIWPVGGITEHGVALHHPLE